MQRVVWILLLLCFAVFGRDLAGKYAGDWVSDSSGAGGTMRLSLEAAGQGKWKLDVTFTIENEDVKTVMQSVKVEGNRLEAAYDFDFAGNKLRSAISGQLNGDALTGSYKTTAVESGAPVDGGTWKASPAR